ncbi:hypothetical protein [Glutamicibacter halophytocola]|uniref:hypothetical protein n=1 Tax=Glutamicibacter halophytocola TaxID=1933880 RepID=UPI001892902A|nr:hypothetical protein [Glutamicibacter halophytocola]
MNAASNCVGAMHTALVAIQEQHAELTIYEWDHDSGDFGLNSDGEKIVVARLCLECTPESIKEQIDDAAYDAAGNYDDVPFPCPTRKLADEGLGGGERG